MSVVVTTRWLGGLRVEHACPVTPARHPPLLFVHGMWGGGWCFEHYLCFAAGAGHEAWALNLRGHHGSRPVADLGTVTFADYVADVAAVLDAVGPAVVVGHSMGGLLAQSVACRRDVLAAVLVASVPPPGIPLASWALARRAPRYALAILGRRAFRVCATDAEALALNALPEDAREAMAARFVEDSGRVAWQVAFGEVEPPAPFRCPALVVGATADRLTPAALQRRIAARYGADYLEVLGRGHMLPVEPGWQASIGRILSWLDGAVAPTGTRQPDGHLVPV
jgi:pimeloyl-ACP methyl ester carboxylesterase